MQPIIITNDADDGHWTVTQGDRFADSLMWAEMCEQVFSLTHPKILKGPYRMHTKAEQRVENARRELMAAERALEAERASTGIAF